MQLIEAGAECIELAAVCNEMDFYIDKSILMSIIYYICVYVEDVENVEKYRKCIENAGIICIFINYI